MQHYDLYTNPGYPLSCTFRVQDNGVKAEPDQKPELPSDPLHEDVTQLAEAAARKLQALDPPPKLKEELLAFDSPGGLSVSPRPCFEHSITYSAQHHMYLSNH